ncbi:MAG: hypothetical protein A2583_08075 [Bdellovibrionales bacterium RIFOXYD1_FULL_53_11]|nr:MAG: hypothetical protein A2583_08075 [Bdellovibrionales bacterium RIFOXYD1_FULL_53_11]
MHQTDNNPYCSKNVLVTGAAGYIGLSLVRRLAQSGAILRLVDLPDKKPDTPAHETLCFDIRDASHLADAARGMDFIFHLAGQTSHFVANDNPLDDLGLNVTPAIVLLEAARKSSRGARIVFASTATVVGPKAAMPVDENAHEAPATVYDIHKLAVEKYLDFYSKHHGVPSCALRLANVYGFGFSTPGKDRGVLNKMAVRAVRGEPLLVFGNGGWIRDYIHHDDVVEAFMCAGTASGIFNVCTGTGTRFVDAVAMVAEEAGRVTGRKPEIIFQKNHKLSAIDERSYTGDPAALQAATQWRPRITLEEGIRRLVLEATDIRP